MLTFLVCRNLTTTNCFSLGEALPLPAKEAALLVFRCNRNFVGTPWRRLMAVDTKRNTGGRNVEKNDEGEGSM